MRAATPSITALALLGQLAIAHAEPIDDEAPPAAAADLGADLAPLATLGFAGRAPHEVAVDPDVAARQMQRDLEAGLWNAYRGVTGSVRADAFAAATGDGALGGTASLRGEVAIPLCRLVAVEASASANTVGDTAYDARAGACLPMPVGRPFVQLGQQRQIQRSPLELPRAGAARLDGWTFDFDSGGYRFLWQHHQIDFGNARLNYVQTHDATRADASHELNAEGIQWRRLGKGLAGETQAWTLARVRFAGVEVERGPDRAAPHPGTVLIHFLAVDNLPLGPHVALSAGVGLEDATISETRMATTATATPTTTTLATDQRVGYDVALDSLFDVGTLGLRTKLRAQSIAEPWLDAQVVRGHELSAAASATWHDDVVGDLRLVGARVTRFGVSGDSAPMTTAGASASVVARVRGPLHAFARVDVAHQLATDGRPRTSMLATAGLSAAIERRR